MINKPYRTYPLKDWMQAMTETTERRKYHPSELRIIIIENRMVSYHEYPDMLVARYLIDRYLVEHSYAWSEKHGWLKQYWDGNDEENTVWMNIDESIIVDTVAGLLLNEFCDATKYSEREKWAPALNSERVFGIVKLLRNLMRLDDIAPDKPGPNLEDDLPFGSNSPWLDSPYDKWPTTEQDTANLVHNMRALRESSY